MLIVLLYRKLGNNVYSHVNYSLIYYSGVTEVTNVRMQIVSGYEKQRRLY